MPASDLDNNPFTLLRVTPRATREEIADAYEDLAAEGEIEEAALLAAQQALMASRPRLAAELSWLTGLAPARAKELLHQKSLALEDIAKLPPLPASNLIAARLSQSAAEALPDLLLALIAAHRELSPARLAEIVNAERQSSGFPQAPLDLVASAYEALREQQIAAALAALKDHESPGLLLERTIQPFLDRRDHALDFLEQLIEAFDRSHEASYARIDAEIASQEEKLRLVHDSEGALDDIDRLLVEWDDLSQPRQLLFQAKGLDEPRSLAIYRRLRDLAIDLANEHEALTSAKRISQALHRTFPELPGALPQLNADLETLEGLIKGQEEAIHAQPFIELFGPFIENPAVIAESLRKHGFDSTSGGSAGKLFNAYKKLLGEAPTPSARDIGYRAANVFAVIIVNKAGDRKAAEYVLEALLSLTPSPSPELRAEIKANLAANDQAKLYASLEAAMKAGNPDEVRKICDHLLANETDPETIESLQQIRTASIARAESAASTRRFWRWAAAIIVIGVIGFAYFDGNKKPQHRPSSTPTATNFSPSNAGAYEETRPPPHGETFVYTLSQLRYCEFNFARIEAMRPHVKSDAQNAHFNKKVADFNAVCANGQYYTDDQKRISRELAAQSSRLEVEARREIEAVSTNPSASRTIDLSRDLLNTAERTQARRIQQRLFDLGFYAGSIDGIWGQKSRDALNVFKLSRSMPANGAWDISTQRALFRDR